MDLISYYCSSGFFLYVRGFLIYLLSLKEGLSINLEFIDE